VLSGSAWGERIDAVSLGVDELASIFPRGPAANERSNWTAGEGSVEILPGLASCSLLSWRQLENAARSRHRAGSVTTLLGQTQQAIDC
jgi:hypothetical protein